MANLLKINFNYSANTENIKVRVSRHYFIQICLSLLSRHLLIRFVCQRIWTDQALNHCLVSDLMRGNIIATGWSHWILAKLHFPDRWGWKSLCRKVMEEPKSIILGLDLSIIMFCILRSRWQNYKSLKKERPSNIFSTISKKYLFSLLFDMNSSRVKR